MGAPRKGQGGHLTPLDFDKKISYIITVAPRVEIQMHFWKGAKFAGFVGHPMTKMLSASTRHGAPNHALTPSAAYGPLEKNPVGAPAYYPRSTQQRWLR